MHGATWQPDICKQVSIWCLWSGRKSSNQTCHRWWMTTSAGQGCHFLLATTDEAWNLCHRQTSQARLHLQPRHSDIQTRCLYQVLLPCHSVTASSQRRHSMIAVRTSYPVTVLLLPPLFSTPFQCHSIGWFCLLYKLSRLMDAVPTASCLEVSVQLLRLTLLFAGIIKPEGPTDTEPGNGWTNGCNGKIPTVTKPPVLTSQPAAMNGAASSSNYRENATIYDKAPSSHRRNQKHLVNGQSANGRQQGNSTAKLKSSEGIGSLG